MVRCKRPPREVLFEWQHQRISFKDVIVRGKGHKATSVSHCSSFLISFNFLWKIRNVLRRRWTLVISYLYWSANRITEQRQASQRKLVLKNIKIVITHFWAEVFPLYAYRNKWTKSQKIVNESTTDSIFQNFAPIRRCCGECVGWKITAFEGFTRTFSFASSNLQK